MFKDLPQSNGLSKGADLWILQNPVHSILSKKIDWHLRFASRKPTVRHQSALLVESSMDLPNQLLLFLPFHSSSKMEWIQKAQQTWIHLKKPSLRLFLPSEISQVDLRSQWPVESLPYLIQVVRE